MLPSDQTEATIPSTAVPGVLEVLAPATQSVPLVFAVPHSGRAYPPEFITRSRLDPVTLRRSEDAFVDEIFAAAPDHGAPLLCARFPRAFVDANREPFELDPAMFADPLPEYVITASPRIADGLGTVAKLVAGGEEIYGTKLDFEEVRQRIEAHHHPYHRTLDGLVQATRERFGACLLIDCHSMPSAIARGKSGQVDMILGDCRGTAAAPEATAAAEAALVGLGFTVARNNPYAGGYTTRHYGHPAEGVHALQIEINRRLYMDEKAIARGPGLPALARRMESLMEELASLDLPGPGKP